MMNHLYFWLKKHVDPVIPLYSIVPLLSCFALNMIVYSGTMSLCKDWVHYDLTTPLDQSIPLVSSWMYVYFGCYVFWVINYILVARIYRDDKSTFYRFVTTDMVSRLVCAFFFMAFPTTNVRPEIIEATFSDKLLAFLYRIDQPTNLFPSIHCLVSWLCFAGIRKSEKVTTWYKVFSCIMALLVVASTQFTKQHYIADAVAGIAIAEFLFWLNKRISVYRWVEHFFTALNRKSLALLRIKRRHL